MDLVGVVEAVSDRATRKPGSVHPRVGPQLLHEGVRVPGNIVEEGEAVRSRLVTPAAHARGVIFFHPHDELLELKGFKAAEDRLVRFLAGEDMSNFDSVLQGGGTKAMRLASAAPLRRGSRSWE